MGEGDSNSDFFVSHKILLLVMVDLSTKMPFPGDISSSAEGTPRVPSASSLREKRSDIQGEKKIIANGNGTEFFYACWFKKECNGGTLATWREGQHYQRGPVAGPWFPERGAVLCCVSLCRREKPEERLKTWSPFLAPPPIYWVVSSKDSFPLCAPSTHLNKQVGQNGP